MAYGITTTKKGRWRYTKKKGKIIGKYNMFGDYYEYNPKTRKYGGF